MSLKGNTNWKSDRAVYAAIWQEQVAFDDDDQDDDEDDDDDDDDYDDDVDNNDDDDDGALDSQLTDIQQSTGKHGAPLKRRANANFAFFSVSFSWSTH